MTSGSRPTATPRTGRPRSSAVDGAILSAALDEFTEVGLQGVTIARVAARAGVPRSTVYRRWSTVEDLCRDALDLVRDPVPTPPGGSVRDDVLFILEYTRGIVTASRFGELLPQLAVEARRDPGQAHRYVSERIGPDRAVLAAVMRRGIAEGSIRGDIDIDLVLDTFVGIIVYRSLWGPAPVTSAQMADIVDAMLAGLAPVG